MHRLYGGGQVDRRPQRRGRAWDRGDRRRSRGRGANRQAHRARVRRGRGGRISRRRGGDHAGAVKRPPAERARARRRRGGASKRARGTRRAPRGVARHRTRVGLAAVRGQRPATGR